MRVKKYIEVPEEILVGLAEGKFIEGSLHRDKDTGRIVFNAYNRKTKNRKKDKLLASLEHGWLKESPKCIKYYCAVKKSIGIPRLISAMEREMKIAKDILMEREIVDRV